MAPLVAGDGRSRGRGTLAGCRRQAGFLRACIEPSAPQSELAPGRARLPQPHDRAEDARPWLQGSGELLVEGKLPRGQVLDMLGLQKELRQLQAETSAQPAAHVLLGQKRCAPAPEWMPAATRRAAQCCQAGATGIGAAGAAMRKLSQSLRRQWAGSSSLSVVCS